MSTCPSNDIHSVYLDNELPETYVRTYEEHIKSCPKCAAKLASLRTVSAAFRTEAGRMVMDGASLDKSWERLQARLSYSKTTKRVYRFPEHNFRYALSAAAAAAVFALIIPLRVLRSPSAVKTAAINPIARNGSVELTKNTVVINGNIEQPHAFIPSDPSASYGTGAEYRTAFDASFVGTRFDAVRTGERQLEDVDLFRPDFANGSTLAIKIGIPEIGFVPPAADIDFANGQLVGSLK
ncbi:anti-sigma factor [Treponema sp. Marseille-Q4132]|uniref:anti-sigma factor family protein n=1 Tax=Treponema sp. Marseille-Q4132 TaxID=2766701 RepID=UPI001652BA86|nr:hypothetical protein [Treponema sp. Marseille-Q4132]QNL96662.1 hypothetical protein H9I35_09490 [Treponema sp. Marseille-Q4132]